MGGKVGGQRDKEVERITGRLGGREGGKKIKVYLPALLHR